jgi:hypothetical protein
MRAASTLGNESGVLPTISVVRFVPAGAFSGV